MKKGMFWLAVLFCAAGVHGQSTLTVRSYTTDDGLSQRNITDMAQDDEGFLWFASFNGLDRFDGYTFENFKTYPDDEVRISNHRFVSIDKSSRHRLWCTTHDRHCYPFNTETLKFEDLTSVKGLSENRIEKVFPLAGGITWLSGDQALLRVDENALPQRHAVKAYPEMAGSAIKTVYMDSQGREWILSDTATILMHHQQTLRFIPFDHIAEAGSEVLLATGSGLLARYDEESESICTLLLEKLPSSVLQLKPLRDGRLLIVQTSALSLFRPDSGPLVTYKMTLGREAEIHQDRDGFLWILRRNGDVMRVDPDSGHKKNYAYPKIHDNEAYSRFRVFLQDRDGGIWIKPYKGEFCTYRPKTDLLQQAAISQNGQTEPFQMRTLRLLEDRQNNLWINSENGLQQLCFTKQQYTATTGPDGCSGRALAEDLEQRLWIGWKNEADEAGGYVCVYDSTGRRLANVTDRGEFTADPDRSFGAQVYCIECDRQGNIWIGTKREGLYVLVPQKNGPYRAVHYQHHDNDSTSLSASSIYDILLDSQGHIWLGSYGDGLLLVDCSEGIDHLRFINFLNQPGNYPAKAGQEIRCLCETRNGLMLAGTTQGLITFSNRFNRPEDISFYFNAGDATATSLSNNDIYHIFQHSDGRIFLSSMSGGLSVTDESELLKKNIRFRHYHALNSPVSDLTLSVSEDTAHCLWVAAENKLSRLNSEMQLLTEFEAVHPTEASPLRKTDGQLLFGTQYDVTCVEAGPSSVRPEPMPVAFLYLDTYRDGRSERHVIHNGQTQRLKADQRNCTISFSALDFSGSNAIRYAYRIPEKSKEWIPLGTSHQAHLADMAAGDYTFQVRSTDAQGLWCENICALSLHVQPRFSETGWAVLLYVVLALMLTALTGFYVLRMLNLRRQVADEQKLSDLKLQFFTDISHELRTPLTLISSPVEEVLLHERLSDDGRGNLQLVQQNIGRMMQLVNQILDCRKIQDGRMKIFITELDIVPVIRRLYERFRPMADKQRIDFRLACESQRMTVCTDADKFEKIVVNLLSNAFKYTPAGKRITLKTGLEKDRLMIVVEDEGKGIKAGRMSRLFDRFDTLDEADPSISTGLGLALVKQLMELLHGQIEVESREGLGSTFTVSLPVTAEAYRDDPAVEFILDDQTGTDTDTSKEDVEETVVSTQKRQVLVIEDNDELRQFISSILNAEFEVLQAGNGREGLDLTRQAGPDLVISDIMMPEMNGIDFLKAVRGDTSLSHIPIILLSAKATVDDQIKGLDYGADDYITKPFSSSFLKAKIHALLRQRQHLLDRLTAPTAAEEPTGALEPSEPQMTRFDRDFLKTLVGQVEDNFQNAGFRIDDLAGAFHMSRTVFYRKVKSLTGASPVDFVIDLRIKRAMQLLLQSPLSISEIGYATGFSTPQYFTRVFKRINGCTPKEYRNRNNAQKVQV